MFDDGMKQIIPPPKQPSESIQWQGSISELQAFFEVLYDLKKINSAQYYKYDSLIKSHFTDKEGNPFKVETLHSSKSRAKNTSQKFEKVKTEYKEELQLNFESIAKRRY